MTSSRTTKAMAATGAVGRVWASGRSRRRASYLISAALFSAGLSTWWCSP